MIPLSHHDNPEEVRDAMEVCGVHEAGPFRVLLTIMPGAPCERREAHRQQHAVRPSSRREGDWL
eukprot:CAMPEP_0185180126 /NCGR_PEP_ID=MMETSP1139-20130426/32357_1 /TAXON_ID=298111 /ORGANISM="Pavlova sp., Strain CCMP459" /LENGTH=63 /DNA_ID=CAMNT_0027745961 /DNA_START=170 /DNA_END=361 /DNA_ORIENTATION=+